MVNFFAALTFLTILPAPRTKGRIGAGTLPWFPVVGLVIGGLIFLFDYILLRLFPVQITALFFVLLLAVITGGIHLDGLADTADGLFSHRSREDALRIMKASDIGAMGAMALFFILGLKWAALANLPRGGWASWVYLVLPAAYGRSAMLFGTYFLPYARREGGTGRDFVSKEGVGRFLLVAPLMGFPLLAGLKAFLWMNTIFLLMTAAILAFYKKKIGGITGDMLGALNELVETALFLTGVFLINS
ncbi:MAG: adenosylcobinamide-GDP ribazoletransferase [Thermodesulfobacteriota bacterium]